MVLAAGCGKADDGEDAGEAGEDVWSTLESSITASYMGAMKNGAGEDEGTCYFAFTDELAILALVDSAVENCVSYVGDYEDDGEILTITDDETGNSITFEYQEQNQGYVLSIEELDSYGALAPTDASKVIAALKSFDAELNALDPNYDADAEAEDEAEADVEDTFAALEASITAAYVGSVKDEEGNEDGNCYFAFAGETAVAAMVDESGENTLCFVGSFQDNGDGTLTIEDNATGNTLLMGLEEAEDFEGYYLSFEEYGATATVIPTDAATITGILAVIDQGTAS